MNRTFALISMFSILLPMQLSAELLYRTVDSSIAGAPAHLVPVSPAQIATSRMNEIFSEILSERHDFSSLPADTSLLEEIAGRGLPMEAAGDPNDDTILVVEEDFVIPAAHEGDAAGDAPWTGSMSRDLSSLMMTPEGVRALAAMSPDQIEALMVFALALDDPEAMRSSLLSRHMGPGMPALSEREPSIPDIGSPAGVDGTMLLRGWGVRMDDAGQAVMYQESISGSDIRIDEGMIVGALGEIVDIRRFGDRVIVNFASGDTLSGPAGQAFQSPGIPPLTDIDEPSPPFDGEILLSSLPQVRTISTSGNLDGRPVVDVVRPASRPRDFLPVESAGRDPEGPDPGSEEPIGSNTSDTAGLPVPDVQVLSESSEGVMPPMKNPIRSAQEDDQ